MKIPTINSIVIFLNSKIDPEHKMKKTRLLARKCIAVIRSSQEVVIYYFYRKIVLPSKFFIKKYFPGLIYIRTSASDTDSYKNFCRLAAKDDSVFATFRINKKYAYNLGNYDNDYIDNNARQIALDIIKKKYADLIKYFEKFEESEKFGGPLMRQCEFGKFSDPTIRYIKALGEIKKVFGSLDNFNIIEIGVGYGGQCKIISDVFNFRSYSMVDLSEVLLLAEKYLKKLNVQNINYIPPEKISGADFYDLIISNAAFAECERFVQQDYIDKILSKAKRGFIIYNSDISSNAKYDSVQPYSREQTLRILSKYHKPRVFRDYPADYNKPIIIVWDDTSKLKI